ncbi:MAG: tetratricopeptide repeat protein [Proteobacteria bacterium]|nr:tetratricopeptide repeat protein [Pseudomonadota bacterium]
MDQRLNKNFQMSQQRTFSLPDGEDEISLEAIFRTFKRRRGILFATIFLLMGLTALVVFQLPKEYTADVLLEIEPRTNKVIDPLAILSGLPMDTETILTEIEIIRSRALHQRVVEKLNLTRDPEFNSSLTPSTLAGLLPFLQDQETPAAAQQNEVMFNTIRALGDKLDISNNGLSRTITISVRSEDPQKAALIVNTLTDEYLNSQLEAKFDELERTSGWLTERLSDLVPASGHLLHMPSHIYVKTGRWEKAIIQNEKAMCADKVYRVLSPEQLTQHGYMTHNSHMLAYAAMMSGREEKALAAARDMWENLTEDTLRQLGPRIDRIMCSVYDVQKRFGRWDAILAEPAPPSYMPITTATWRAARAVAYAAKKDFANAENEYDAFKIAKAGISDDTPWARDLAQRVLEVSAHFIGGEIALQKGEWDKAAELLEKAAAVEDTLPYGEPPRWIQPVRHTLGAVYLKSRNYPEAERVYREDLAKWPNNGWSLYGLSRALEQQEKTEEAMEAMEKHHRIWVKADAQIATSCMCIPKT